MSTRIAEGLMAFFLVLLSATVMWKSSELNIGWVEGRGPGSGVWPFWLAALMGLASLVALVRFFLQMTPESRNLTDYIDRDTVALVMITAFGLLALIISIHVVGVYFSFMIFLLLYLKLIGQHSWTETMTTVLAVPVIIYLLFEVALTTYLPKGWPFFEELFLAVDNVRYDIQYSANSGLISGLLALNTLGAIGVGLWARRLGINPLLAALGSIVVTPILGGVGVFLMGKKRAEKAA
ncbi:MAG: tripartite tricarboxylate transporter TctB family protein [Pseudomonadota bacterium]